METIARKLARKLVRDLTAGKHLPQGANAEALERAIEASLLEESATIPPSVTAELGVFTH